MSEPGGGRVRYAVITTFNLDVAGASVEHRAGTTLAAADLPADCAGWLLEQRVIRLEQDVTQPAGEQRPPARVNGRRGGRPRPRTGEGAAS